MVYENVYSGKDETPITAQARENIVSTICILYLMWNGLYYLQKVICYLVFLGKQARMKEILNEQGTQQQ